MNYPKTAAKAALLLRKSGMDMALRVKTPGEYDPVTGYETGAVLTDHACVGILTNPFVSQRESFFANSRILEGDKVAVIGPNVTVRPEPGHVLVVGDEEWQVVGVISIAPANVAIIYKLQVRRG